MSPESFVLLFDAFVVVVVLLIVRQLRRPFRQLPQHNYRPSDDDARSGRRVTLLIYPKGRKPR